MSFTESIDELVAADESGLLGVHSTWVRVRMADVCSILNGFPFASGQFKASGGTPLIRIRDVVRGRTDTHFVGDFDTTFIVRHGELVVGMDGDFHCALWSGGDALLNQRVCKLTPDERYYDLRLLAHALPGYLGAINSKTSAITVKHLSSKTVAEIPLPLPPRREQARLAEAIESYFTRLDDAVATLERVQRNLKRYRASVLKAAVEGRLVPTEAELARSECRGYEAASVLLTRMLAERRRRWEEAELAKMTARGKMPADEKWKAKYVEPHAPDAKELPKLPEGWCWASIDQLGDVSGGLTQNAKREALPLQLPFLRVANVYANELRLDEIKTIGVSGPEVSRARLAPGDLLVVEGNGSIDQIGRVALWDGAIDPCLHQNHIIKVRFTPVILANWALCWLLAPAGRVAVERAASSTSGLHTLSLSKVQRLPLPLAPLAEQTRIASEVDRLITIALAAEGDVGANTQRCTHLRRSILKWAFEGRLVDQNPTDEPASVLIERLRAERGSATDKTPRRARRAKARVRKS